MVRVVVTAYRGAIESVMDKLKELMTWENCTNLIAGPDIRFLNDELFAMNALLKRLEDADDDKLDAQVKDWRNRVRETAYDIEDSIDDFRTTTNNVDDGTSNKASAGFLDKASRFLKACRVHLEAAWQIKELRNRLQEIHDRRKRYKVEDHIISSSTSVLVDPRISAFYKEAASLVGIDSPKRELIEMVMDGAKHLKVVSIVGFGGLGKTTLASQVYREVGAQFNCNKAFVSVSQKPDMVRLLTSVLLQLKQRPPSHASGVQDLINILREYLTDKRYFIIVDDLWDVPAWNIVACAFPQNNRHSRVMITTRNGDVAKACSSDHGCIHNMKPLSEQDSRKLFFNRIFGSKNDEDCPNSHHLKEVSFQILKKCGGLPLAIVTVSSVLACQPATRMKEQWEYVRRSLVTNNESTARRQSSTLEDMMHILDLSYKSLPHHLKPCFLYLGAYPEDCVISKVELVKRWVAEGFVMSPYPAGQQQDAWAVAESYFNELVNRSMIQLPYKDYNYSEVSHCRVHDMMLDMILRRCREDNFLSVTNDPQQAVTSEVQNNKIRRLTINLNGAEDGGTTTTAMKKKTSTTSLQAVRSLALFGGSKWIPPLMEFRFLRVLFLEFFLREMIVDLTGINQLSQLRYLKVESKECLLDGDGPSKLSITLPGQIRRLRYLETLELPWVSDCSIPSISEIVDLPCLSHLVLRQHKGALPDGIGKVKSLHTLHGFNLPVSSLKNIYGLGELVNLSDLSFHWGEDRRHSTAAVVVGWMPALGCSLQKLGNLKGLSVRSSSSSSLISCCADDLSSSWSSSPPFLNLEKFDLLDWTFSRVPVWIGQLHCLRELALGANLILQEDVDMIGKRLHLLVHLSLRLVDVPRVHPTPEARRTIVVSGATGFSALRFLCFDCSEMSCLAFEVGAMSKLRRLLLALDPRGWDKATPAGLDHLPCLEEIRVLTASSSSAACLGSRSRKPRESELMIREVFQDAVNTLPSPPAFMLLPRFRSLSDHVNCCKINMETFVYK